jgi:hypothetical protein
MEGGLRRCRAQRLSGRPLCLLTSLMREIIVIQPERCMTPEITDIARWSGFHGVLKPGTKASPLEPPAVRPVLVGLGRGAAFGPPFLLSGGIKMALVSFLAPDAYCPQPRRPVGPASGPSRAGPF